MADEVKIKRPTRPNYNAIHTKSLPLTVEAYPPLIPHNPLSVLVFVGVYLFRLARSPSSHSGPQILGILSPSTRSVHITDEESVQKLWRDGFFGKGSLSRSEPSWLDREKKRRGLLALDTSEEVTRKRREERRLFKEERARAEQALIEATRRKELGVPEASDESMTAATDIAATVEKAENSSESIEALAKTLATQKLGVEILADDDIEDFEHLQLDINEAFFLSFGLGVLSIKDSSSGATLSQPELLDHFRRFTHFPTPKTLSPASLAIDPFLSHYAVYHHFRSLGWVVRPGMKFGVDFLLYLRGPVFAHAEFAIIVKPSFDHPFWSSEEGMGMRGSSSLRKEQNPWWWLHMVNRVQSQVRKTLVVAYVEIPPPHESDGGIEEGLSVKRLLRRYKVREVVVRRWMPNRHRD